MRKKIDWEAVEVDYRCGVKSLRAMADEHGCAESAIRKRAKQEQWPRDLSAKIKAKTDELVRKEEVRIKVRTETPTERQQVEIAAQTQTNVILSHRADIARGRTLAMRLLAELEDITDHPIELDELGELLRNPDKSGKDRLNDIYRAIIGHPSRVDSMKKLAETLKTLIASEREAFGIESKTPIDDALKASGIQVSFVAANVQK